MTSKLNDEGIEKAIDALDDAWSIRDANINSRTRMLDSRRIAASRL